MPGKIHLLSDLTINQIAAGEVIESSASIVKELVDNAVDAGAQEIIVETQGGGRALIRVSDDGCGMGRDDLLLSVERHATSKMKKSEDLFSLSTLGFRGEALPSIASVSKMMISSASKSGGGGTALFLHGGRMEKSCSVSRRPGTTVEVRALFFNVPVRKRFQKRVEADSAEIHKILTKAALCFPTVKFTWINGNRQEFSVGKDDPLIRRIEVLLGQGLCNNLLPIDFEQNRCKIEGFISTPSLHRPNRLGHHLFLNRRAVFSPFISYRFVEAYGTRLPAHRYPLFVCHLSLPVEWVDVNVHPQKREVRLREERMVGEFLMEAAERALGKRPGVVMPQRFALPEAKPLMVAEEAPVYHTQTTRDFSLPLAEKKIRGIGFAGSYFLAERQSGEWLLVDERAARMRIYFERMIKCEKKIAQQMLLFPLSVEFAPNEAKFIQAHSDLLNEVGIGIRSFGKNAFVVDAIPQFFENEEIHLLLEGLIEDLGGVKSPAKKELALSLCRLIKRKKLSIEGGERLVEELLKCETPHECPRGRPTYICLDEETIARDYFS